MSRVGNMLDWDYAATDTARAVAGTDSQAGLPGDPITALIPHSDDYLVISCLTSLWKMTGDPANGGTLVNLSRAVGCVGPKAWCTLPDGSMLFLSLDGLYILDSAGDAYPVSVSRETMPKEFANLEPANQTITMEYDIVDAGVHVFITPQASSGSYHWWLDTGLDTSKSYGVLSTVSRRTLWPFTLLADHEPTATCTLQATDIADSGVVLGGRDGYCRKFADIASTDCGTAFTNYVLIGPIALGLDSQTGTVLNMDATLAATSGNVDWALKPALTFEEAVSAAASDMGTWTAGLNATNHPACRGQAFTLRLAGTGQAWALENITATLKKGGKRRLP
jgi:hypothetical protein